MTRITSAASNSILIARFLRTQRTLHDLETQIATEKRSQTYHGIATQSQRLVNVETARSSLSRFVQTNDTANLRVDIQTTAVDGIKNAVKDFREFLLNFSSGDTTDPDRIDEIQTNAYRALKDLQTLLNTEADGRFIFGGGNVRKEPVNFGLTTLAAFQEKYDGARVTVPTTREAHLENLNVYRNSSTLNPSYLTFEQADGGTGKSRINSAVAQFQNVAAGTTITISGTIGGLNDGTYTVDSVDPNGMWIDVKTEQLTDEAAVFATIQWRDENDPKVNHSKYVEVAFNRRTNTFSAVTADSLAGIPEGAKITISGTANNNGTFTVSSNDDTNLVIESKRLTDDGGTAATVHTVGGANTLTFSPGTGANGEDQIIASATGTYANLQVGQKITINGTDTENDGKTFTVKAVSDTSTTLLSTVITLEDDESVDDTVPTVNTGTVATRPALFSFDAAARNFYFNADAVGASADTVVFTDNGANADTITLTGATFTDAKGNLLPAGTRITVTSTVSNNATYTIASISADGTTATLVATDTVTNETNTAAVLAGSGSITFTDNDPSADSITLGGGFFRDVNGNNFAAGTIFTVAGTGTANDGQSFTIASISSDGRTATLIPTNTVDDTTPTVTTGTMSTANTIGTIRAESYYKGDNISLTHRASNTTGFEFDVTAADPAFEKAIRAMMLIMQGEYGTEGGLDQNSERIGQALYLLDASLDITNTAPPPFGTEQSGSIEEVEINLGFRSVMINDIKTVSKRVIAFFEGNIATTENIDPLEAITRLLDNQRTLEASYQTFARVRQLSLTNFI